MNQNREQARQKFKRSKDKYQFKTLRPRDRLEQVLAPLYFKPHSPLLWSVVTNLNRFKYIDLLPKNCFPDRKVNVKNGHLIYGDV